MIKNFAKSLALLGCFAAGLCSQASAQDSGALLEALVKKGILSDQEAEDIRADLARDYSTGSAAGKLDIAGNITRLRLAGDARVRYQYDNEVPNFGTNNLGVPVAPSAAKDRDRNRYRYRVRFGATVDLGPKWTTAFRLETASGATSTNGDLGAGTDNFDKLGDVVYFGQAYINYKDTNVLGADALDVRLGKVPHKFFAPGVNGFWIDTDLNFEGVAEELVYSMGSNGELLSLRAGQFILNNNAANNNSLTAATVEPSLLVMAQAEFATKKFKVAPTVVAFAAPPRHDIGAANTAVTWPATNPQSSDTAVYNDLATFLVPVEYSTTLNSKPFAAYATYGYNVQGEDRAYRLASATSAAQKALVNAEEQMYNVGVRYGANVFAGDYQLVAEYRYVGNGSYSSLLLDSDFNGGLLNGQGYILSGTYSLSPAVTSTITYFNSFNIEKNRIGGASRGNGFGEAQVIQIDLSARF